MRVAAHGNVDDFCKEHGMRITERYVGDVSEYAGRCVVLVTDNCETENEYYWQKYTLRKRGVELVSTHWFNESLAEFVEYMDGQSKKRKRFGRPAFGFRWENGERVELPEELVVARRIVELRDQGKTYREISADEGVSYPDGRRMSISTIQVILRHRGLYEHE